MKKRILLFAPAAFNLAETSRMLEIAKGIRQHVLAKEIFDIQFISNGGGFEVLIEEEGFPLQRLEPRLTREKIEYIGKVDKGEVLKPAFTFDEIQIMVEHEIAYLEKIKPTAVITGSYLTIPLTCQILEIPLVWVIQSTWLKEFFSTGAGMTDQIHFKPAKKVADWVVLAFIKFWVNNGFLNSLNQAARHYGVKPYETIFDYWRGDLTLVAEPAGFSGIELPPNHYFTGPLIAQQNFPIPEALQTIPRDQPLIYFAMGSSGTPKIVANIVKSFAGKPYRVIAPVKFHLDNVPSFPIPANVTVTDWLPALQVNKLADLAVLHGGIGTIMTAAFAGKPVVGIGMQPEQDANIACLVRKGFAIRIPKSKNPSKKVQDAIERLLKDPEALEKAAQYAQEMEQWDGPRLAADRLYETFGKA